MCGFWRGGGEDHTGNLMRSECQNLLRTVYMV